MSDRMTSVQLEGHSNGDGWAEYGLQTPEKMIQIIRARAARDKALAEQILSAPDDVFTVQTYVGSRVMRDRKVLQQGVKAQIEKEIG